MLIVCGHMLETGGENLGTLRIVMRFSREGLAYPLAGNTDMTLCIEPTSRGLFCRQGSRCGWWGGPFEWLPDGNESGGGSDGCRRAAAVFPHDKRRR